MYTYIFFRRIFSTNFFDEFDENFSMNFSFSMNFIFSTNFFSTNFFSTYFFSTNDLKPKCSSWLPAHPGEKLPQSIGLKLLQCSTCGKWAYGLLCNHTRTPQTPPVGNDNVKSQPADKINKEVIYIDNEALPHYEYFDKTNMAATEDRDPLYLESDYSYSCIKK